MAHLPGFEFEVFVSYAHSDNLAVRRESGWVSRFVDVLHAALRQRLGGAADLRIYFDKPEARANFELTELPGVVARQVQRELAKHSFSTILPVRARRPTPNPEHIPALVLASAVFQLRGA